MNDNQSIKETLNIIRKALEDDEPINNRDNQDNILILNKLIKEDGTINLLDETSLSNEKIINTFKNKLTIPGSLDEYFQHNEAWHTKLLLSKNYLEVLITF